MVKALIRSTVACILLLIAADVRSQPPEFAEVADFIRRQVDAGRTPSVAVGVVKDDRVVWTQAFGLADVEKKTPATPDSIYRLASVSKPITATGLMILRDRGLVDLDAPANRYLTNVKLRTYVGSADAMTLRRLANHTSGLPTHYNFFYEGTPLYSMDDAIRRYGFASKEPGTGFEYSNLGFGILNFVTEVTGKQPWAEFMKEHLYAPLNMERTTHDPRKKSDAVTQYTLDLGGRWRTVAYYDFDHPGGSVICSSANDMLRFARMHLNDGILDGTRVLRAETAKEMRVPTSERSAQMNYGVGWMVTKTGVMHGGGMPGVSTALQLFPESKSALVVLSNSDSPGIVPQVAARIADVLVPKKQTEPRRASDEEQKPSVKWSGKWIGTLKHFSGDVALILEIKEDKEVFLRCANRPEITLRDVSFRGHRLTGSFDGKLETQPSFHGTPRLRLEVQQRDDRATGTLSALAPGYFHLAHWVELKKHAASQER